MGNKMTKAELEDELAEVNTGRLNWRNECERQRLYILDLEREKKALEEKLAAARQTIADLESRFGILAGKFDTCRDLFTEVLDRAIPPTS